VKKIPITAIDKAVHSFRGIDEEGCFRTECDDECCKYGADVDKETYELIVEHKRIIETEIGINIERCFKKGWLNDEPYLGGNAIQTRVGPHGFCTFHMPSGKGCVLYRLVNERGLPRRLIPSICRLYPLTWAEGKLCIADDLYPTCNCMKKDGFGQNILATQIKEVEDIFHFKAKIKAKTL
jgi:hypothetical protein